MFAPHVLHATRFDRLVEQVGTIVRHPLRWVRRAPLRRLTRERLDAIQRAYPHIERCDLCQNDFTIDDRGLPKLQHAELGALHVCYRCHEDLR